MKLFAYVALVAGVSAIKLSQKHSLHPQKLIKLAHKLNYTWIKADNEFGGTSAAAYSVKLARKLNFTWIKADSEFGVRLQRVMVSNSPTTLISHGFRLTASLGYVCSG